jgi:hypothetical protein
MCPSKVKHHLGENGGHLKSSKSSSLIGMISLAIDAALSAY